MDSFLGMSDDAVRLFFPNISKAAEAGFLKETSDEKLRSYMIEHSRQVECTSKALDYLNLRKCAVIANEISSFVNSFRKIKKIDYKETDELSDYNFAKLDLSDYEAMSDCVVDIGEFLKTGVKSYAIGGIIIGGIIMHKKAQIAMNKALEHQDEIDAECEKIETNIMKLQSVRKLARQEDYTLRKLVRLVRKPLDDFSKLVEMKADWQQFSIEEKQLTASLMSLVKLIKELIFQPIINSEGEMEDKIELLIQNKNIIKLIQ